MSQNSVLPVLGKTEKMTTIKNNLFSRSNAKKLHYFSGLTLSVFIAFHLFNQLYSLAGPAAHIEMMETFRKLYRHPVLETLLMVAVSFQLITGISMLFNKRKKNRIEKLQIYSGLYLSYFLLAHVAAVLYGRYLQLDTNFNFAAAGLNDDPAMLYFIPYYFFAVLAIFLHVAAIHYLKTGSALGAWVIGSIGVLVATGIIIGYTDSFHFRKVPAEYLQFVRAFFGGS